MKAWAAVKRFTIQEGSIQGGHYRAEVYDHTNTRVELIEAPTMEEVHRQLEKNGYRRASRSESAR